MTEIPGTQPETLRIPVGLGMSSLVLGTIGLALALMPVLGLPISASGLLIGIVGVFVARFGRRGTNLRWALQGVAVSFLALSANVAITQGTWGDAVDRPNAPTFQGAPDRAYVAPAE